MEVRQCDGGDGPGRGRAVRDALGTEGNMSATAFSAMDRSWYRELHGFPARSLTWDGAESPQSDTGETDENSDVVTSALRDR